MDNSKIIKLDLYTKIMYSLFNFFAPVSFVFIIACSFELYDILTTLVSFIAIFIGLFCLIFNLIRYNRFLYIDDKTINICKGKIDNPKVLKAINIDSADLTDISKNFTVKYEQRKIKLIYHTFSILGIICYIGPLIFIPVFKYKNVAIHKLYEFNRLIPKLSLTNIKEPTKGSDIIVNTLAWGFVLLVTFLGSIGLLFTPFYPFLN